MLVMVYTIWKYWALNSIRHSVHENNGKFMYVYELYIGKLIIYRNR